MTQIDSTTLPVSASAIETAARLIEPYVRRTPVIDIDAADLGLAGAPLNFKLELLQHTGSFKARGAFTQLLTGDVPAAGVVAASGGNHGAAVAFAAMKRGVNAAIFVPEISAQAKLDRIRAYNADLHVTGARYADALAASEAWAADTGAIPIHAYDQVQTLVGQGTTAREWEAQCPDLNTVLVSVGGGGLIGGMASWYAGRVKVVAVEPEAAPTLHRALAAGKPVDAPAEGIAADSLGPRQVGRLMFPIAQAYVDHVALVSDAAIVAAQHQLWDVLRIAAEPGGAAALAALASGSYRPAPSERVGVLVCGGNTGAVRFD